MKYSIKSTTRKYFKERSIPRFLLSVFDTFLFGLTESSIDDDSGASLPDSLLADVS